MASKKSSESARRQAQDLAYRAMSTPDTKEALRLCMKALEIDPRCVDALTLATGAFDPEERIDRLTDVVKMAEEELGGESYLEQNKGHFWGLLETRPYMRARSSLAWALEETGKTKAAIKEYKALLNLNPGDNQGLRYILIGLYLETDDTNGARRLLDEYREDDSAMLTWSAVLERLISNDTEGAEKSLPKARESNPYFEDYLLGRKPMPDEMPAHYGFGDENEAIVCMDAIGGAWKKHPEAIRWMYRHANPSQTAPKAGRNAPCPCGSGKKYKKCCLGRESAQPQIAIGSPIAAEKALSEIMQAVKEREFSSIEEANSFLQKYNKQQNSRPRDDFEGLSPDQMYRLINFPFESPKIVEFPGVLDIDPSAPIVALFRMLADAIGESALKPTAKGNLPLKVVQEIARTYLGEEGFARFTQHGSIRSEENYYDLHVTRIVAELAGLIRKYRGKFILSRECRKLLKDTGMRAVYPILFRTFAEEFNWGYSDYYPEIGFVQSFFAYTLYLLARYGDEWHENTYYEDAFLRAFPSVTENVKSNAYATRENIVRGMYSYRSFQKFAALMGLIGIDKSSENPYSRTFKLRTTPLMGKAVRFHI